MLKQRYVDVNSGLKLVPLNDNSAVIIRELYLDKENVKFMADVIVDWTGGIDRARKTVKTILKSVKDFVWEIKLNDNGVGLVGLENIDFDKKSAEIWFLLAKNYQGQGIMHKSIKKILGYLRDENWMEVRAKVKRDNLRSQNLLSKLFFKKVVKCVERECLYIFKFN